MRRKKPLLILLAAAATVVLVMICTSKPSCRPDIGNNDSLFKIFILNNGGAPFFEQQRDQIINDLKTISPFKENFPLVSIYTLSIPQNRKVNCQSYESGSLGGSGLSCNDADVDNYIKSTCHLSDVHRFIKIVVTGSFFGGSGGEVIVIGSRPQAEKGVSNPPEDLKTSLSFSEHVAIHEIGHNMGLGDLYYGTFYNNANPSHYYDSLIASGFPNTDAAGCPKWCQSTKPVSQYISSLCPKITNESACRSYNREKDRSCIGDTCCVWSNEGFPYFGRCAPAWGTENIGESCLSGTGCYFGAAYSNDAWRPVKDAQSIMLQTVSNEFDPVSRQWLDNVIKSCLTKNQKSDQAFRNQYSIFIKKHPEFKQAIGLCGN